MKRSVLALLISCMMMLSCQKMLLPSVERNTPVSNFESMWKGYDEWYGMFETRQINWDSIYRVYRPQVRDDMSNEALYGVLCGLITPLDDIHAFLQPTTNGLPRFESSAFYRAHKSQEDFSLALIRNKYLPGLQTVDSTLHYGITEGNIGYIHLGEFGMPVSFYKKQLGRIMDTLKNTRAMIVDIRNHAGGDDEVSGFISGLFARDQKLFMTVRKRSGPSRQDFTPPQQWYVEKKGSYQYTKPVVLLTTRWTASAGETFTWAMNTQSHVLQMGDTTSGGFSDVISRELPNGWLYFVGVGDYRNAAGKSEEGIGVAPDVYIVNTKQDIEAGRDRVLEAAIERLK